MLTRFKEFFSEPPSFETQEIPGLGYGIVKVGIDESREILTNYFCNSQDEAQLAANKLSLQN
jgi:hypothetical protein